ncbi:hypothetical protein ACI79D_04160 [Geodermatophilus sp. SYSU D00708]
MAHSRSHAGSERTPPPPPEPPDVPLTGHSTPADGERCPHTHPLCADMRCQRPHHGPDVVCHAVGLQPYWSSFWESPGT